MGLSIFLSLLAFAIPGIDFIMASFSFFMGLFLLGKGDVLLIFGRVFISKMEVTMESCALKTNDGLHTCVQQGDSVIDYFN